MGSPFFNLPKQQNEECPSTFSRLLLWRRLKSTGSSMSKYAATKLDLEFKNVLVTSTFRSTFVPRLLTRLFDPGTHSMKLELVKKQNCIQSVNIHSSKCEKLSNRENNLMLTSRIIFTTRSKLNNYFSY